MFRATSYRSDFWLTPPVLMSLHNGLPHDVDMLPVVPVFHFCWCCSSTVLWASGEHRRFDKNRFPRMIHGKGAWA